MGPHELVSVMSKIVPSTICTSLPHQVLPFFKIGKTETSFFLFLLALGVGEKLMGSPFTTQFSG